MTRAPLRRESAKHAAARDADSPVRRWTAERAIGRCEGCGDPVGMSAFTADAHHVFPRLPKAEADHPDLRVWLCHDCHRDRWHVARPDVDMVRRLERLAVHRLTGRECPRGEYPINVVRAWFRRMA